MRWPELTTVPEYWMTFHGLNLPKVDQNWQRSQELNDISWHEVSYLEMTGIDSGHKIWMMIQGGNKFPWVDRNIQRSQEFNDTDRAENELPGIDRNGQRSQELKDIKGPELTGMMLQGRSELLRDERNDIKGPEVDYLHRVDRSDVTDLKWVT